MASTSRPRRELHNTVLHADWPQLVCTQPSDLREMTQDGPAHVRSRVASRYRSPLSRSRSLSRLFLFLISFSLLLSLSLPFGRRQSDTCNTCVFVFTALVQEPQEEERRKAEARPGEEEAILRMTARETSSSPTLGESIDRRPTTTTDDTR